MADICPTCGLENGIHQLDCHYRCNREISSLRDQLQQAKNLLFAKEELYCAAMRDVAELEVRCSQKGRKRGSMNLKAVADKIVSLEQKSYTVGEYSLIYSDFPEAIRLLREAREIIAWIINDKPNSNIEQDAEKWLSEVED